MNKNIMGRRWSGLDWATEQREILLIGIGSIGSFLMLSLSRIAHSIVAYDGDIIDSTNVEGGQLYRTKDIGNYKAHVAMSICTEFGCTNGIVPITENWNTGEGVEAITIVAV